MMKRTIPIIFSAFLLAACQASSTQETRTMNTRLWAVSVKQDANLYRIDDKLYRSEQPVPEDGETISQQGIKSVVNLRFFDRNDDDYLKQYGINIINRPLLSWNVKPKDIAEILYLIEKQQQNGAVLIHCYHGADRTGLIAGMYRILYQGWQIEEAKAEMQHGPYGYHSIWKNIANLFTEAKIQEVKNHLERLRSNERNAVSEQ
ncbi:MULTISPECIES: tyrosine-protein phosphatase [Neisseriaceae]|jgi:protein tyrosine/serine phosphatase|uniref:Putative TIGR01244 family protein n=1 Tax=Neisseria mucosa (strain ATCC 25996 / DSM 4631 / NCTC 10774 / M26) TaxID=546266 RepID=D3A0C9_NEIM2|nr:putative TIGR01244 family protein [Neisseria mucosa ATCC 25996]SUA37821.1 Protein tyrosine/serine phosphatase [Neisseria mucosa]